MPRLFVALSPPAEIQDQLSRLCTGIDGAKWVKPDQIHVTLRFLGHVDDAVADETIARFAAVRSARPLIALHGVGTFPPARGRRFANVRVLWAGVTPHEAVQACKAAVDAALGPDPETRPFHPHFTLARFKSNPGPQLAAYLAAHGSHASAPFAFAHVTLFESRLGPKGATYVPRAEVLLD